MVYFTEYNAYRQNDSDFNQQADAVYQGTYQV